MALLADLAPSVRGRAAVVMGGAPSLPDDVAKVAHEAVWLSANQHGAMLRQCDYIVYVDPVHQVTREPMQEKMTAFGIPTISPCFGADYRIPDWNATGFKGNSGLHAIWVASMLGCDPIIVCGIDCYQGGTYWHDHGAKSTSAGRPLSFFDGRIEDLKRLIPDANIRAVTPSLARHFPEYRADEKFSPFQRVIPDQSEHEVRFVRPVKIAKTTFKPRQTAMLTDSEIGRYKRYVRRLDGH